MEYLNEIKMWSNENSGFLSLILFLFTFALGWVSGFFKAILKKPYLKIEVIEPKSFCSTFDIGRKTNGKSMHRTAISIYLKIINIGNSPTEVDKVAIGYKSAEYNNPFRWYWLEEEVVCLSDFIVPLGDEDSKVMPFLKQRNQTINNNTSLYLQVASSCLGITYFEQEASTGNYFPKCDENYYVKIKVKVIDTLGNAYFQKSKILKLQLKAAQKWCEKYGQTREKLVENKVPRETDK